jgi:N-acetylmuramoyl-L-alanine amidase
MRRSRVVALGLALGLSHGPAAAANVPHTVSPGETLWSIAYASNLTTRALAAANGLPENAAVITGTTIQIPSVAEAATALSRAPSAGTVSSGAPRPMGAYTVQPGDTLTGIAARSGIAVSQLAWMNGLAPNAYVLTGTVLKLPTGAAPAQQQAAAGPAIRPSVVTKAAPLATPGRVTAGDIGALATAHGVPGSLAAAVAWQESGFNNAVVSPANARGVFQILPGTWQWIQSNMAESPLDPASPRDNVHAGVMYLAQLLRDSGGDTRTAVASYYQGAGSVRRSGMLPETRRYVDDVMALRSRFGG